MKHELKQHDGGDPIFYIPTCMPRDQDSQGEPTAIVVGLGIATKSGGTRTKIMYLWWGFNLGPTLAEAEAHVVVAIA